MMEHLDAVRARIASIQSRFPLQDPVVTPAANGPSFAQTLQEVSPQEETGTVSDSDSNSSNDSHDFDVLIEQASSRYGVDPSLIRAVIKAESGFNSKAVSGVGAQGLMQLMPSTARGLGVTDAFDPAQNINGGTRYLRHLLDRFNGNVDLALAGYNAGPGSVARYGGVPPFTETQNYVRRVQGYMRQLRADEG
jgi:soluble lytic murein transglycosylase-like protein